MRVLLVAMLPPPTGGQATWTRDVLRSSVLGGEVTVELVDRRMGNLDISPLRLSLRRGSRSVQNTAQVARALARRRVDVLHLCSTGQPLGLLRDLPVLVLARAARVPVVLHLHGDGARLLQRPRITRRVAKYIAHTVALGEDSAQSARQAGVDPVSVVPNSIALRPLPERHWARDGVIQLLYVGWFLRSKGLDDLLEAVARVPELRLTLLGRWVVEPDGSTGEERIRARLAQPDLAGRVELVGEVPPDDVWSYYERSDLFALPSHGEGLPMALLEAMSTGLPVVVTPVGAIPEVVTEGEQGHLVPVEDIDALTAALQGWTPDRLAQAGRAARERIAERFSHEVAHKRLLSLWKRLAAE